MAFSRDVKRELAAIVPSEGHCRRAQLSGLLFGAGTFSMGAGGRIAVRVTVSLPAVARNALALLRPYEAEAELRTVSSPPGGRRYEVVLGGEPDLQLLNEAGVLSDAMQLHLAAPARIVERRCCVVAFVRGLFQGCGTLSSPGAPVHVEFTLAGEELAAQTQTLLARLGLDFRLARRGRNVACYSKRSDTAADLLAVLGAHDARLRWEEQAVVGEMRGRANRLANCDEAAARRLRASSVWETMPAALRQAADLRLEHPYLSLGELAAAADPPLSRSALNRRLRRVVELGEAVAPP